MKRRDIVALLLAFLMGAIFMLGIVLVTNQFKKDSKISEKIDSNDLEEAYENELEYVIDFENELAKKFECDVNDIRYYFYEIIPEGAESKWGFCFGYNVEDKSDIESLKEFKSYYTEKLKDAGFDVVEYEYVTQICLTNGRNIYIEIETFMPGHMSMYLLKD